jgi:hypothetical protein
MSSKCFLFFAPLLEPMSCSWYRFVHAPPSFNMFFTCNLLVDKTAHPSHGQRQSSLMGRQQHRNNLYISHLAHTHTCVSNTPCPLLSYPIQAPYACVYEASNLWMLSLLVFFIKLTRLPYACPRITRLTTCVCFENPFWRSVYLCSNFRFEEYT